MLANLNKRFLDNLTDDFGTKLPHHISDYL